MNQGFEVGQRVAWSHDLAPAHAANSILRPSALPETTPMGVIISIENEAGTWLRVQFPDASERVLTSDELVRVSEEN